MTKVYNCPVEVTLDVIGGKWKTVILRYLSERTLRYSQLQQVIPNITQRILTLQLRELEEDGLIARTLYDERLRRFEYSLTEYGRVSSRFLSSCVNGANSAYETSICG